MRILVMIIGAGLVLCACDAGMERMTAPPTEAGVRPWLVPPMPLNQVEPPVVQDEPISSMGAVEVSVDTTQMNVASSGTVAQGGRKGDLFFHLCRTGDTIASVAKAYGMDASTVGKQNGWSASYEPATGMQLLLPRNMDNVATAPDVTTYKVAAGDTFSRVAKRCKLSVAALMTLNRAKGDTLQIGDVLYVPVAR